MASRSNWTVAALVAPIAAALFTGTVVWANGTVVVSEPAPKTTDNSGLILKELQKNNAYLAQLTKVLGKTNVPVPTVSVPKAAPVKKQQITVQAKTGASGTAP
jgi:hypothetical protein